MGSSGLVESIRGGRKVFQAERNPSAFKQMLDKAHVTSNKPRFGAIRFDPGTVSSWITVIPRLLSAANVNVERGSRIAVYQKVLRNTDLTELEQKIRVRDVNVDFSKVGGFIRQVNAVIPFTNAALQGSALIARTWRNNPERMFAFTLTFSAITASNRQYNERFETSKDIPDYEYVRNWVIMFGEGTREDGSKHPLYIKIPKGEYVGSMTWLTEALFNHMRDTEDRSYTELALDGGRDAMSLLSPFSPTEVPLMPLASTTLGITTGTNFFTQAPIVPRREQDLPAGLQWDESTSAASVYLGNKFNISPRKIDFAINDYFAGAGRNTNFLLGEALKSMKFEEEMFGADDKEAVDLTDAERLVNAPGVRRFVGTRDTQQDRRAWERIEDAKSKASKKFYSIPDVATMGIKLRFAPSDIDLYPGLQSPRYKLTVMQQFRFQQLYIESALPLMTNVADVLKDMPNDIVKEKAFDNANNTAMEIARGKMRVILISELSN